MSKKKKRKQKPATPAGEGTQAKPKAVEKEPKKEKVTKPKAKAASVKEKKRTSPAKYFNEVKLELKKVSWPARSEVVKATIIVIIVVIIFGIYTGLLDFAFSNLIKVVSSSVGNASRFGR